MPQNARDCRKATLFYKKIFLARTPHLFTMTLHPPSVDWSSIWFCVQNNCAIFGLAMLRICTGAHGPLVVTENTDDRLRTRDVGIWGTSPPTVSGLNISIISIYLGAVTAMRACLFLISDSDFSKMMKMFYSVVISSRKHCLVETHEHNLEIDNIVLSSQSISLINEKKMQAHNTVE